MINYQKLFKSKRNILFLVFLLILHTGYAQEEKVEEMVKVLEQKEAQIGALGRIMDRDSIPGLQIAYSKNGKKEFFEAGWLKQGQKEYVNVHTAFQAASLTKVVMAYTFFRLYDRGLISLDKPLWEYYKYDRIANNPQAQKITARMVLTHQSGLLNWEGDVPSQAWRQSALTSQFEPGTDYMYSGEGFYFLQETLEHITGKSFQQLVEQEIIKPFKLKDSEILWKDRLAENAAFGHYSNAKARNLGMYRKSNAAYTLYTTASDYCTFLEKAILQGKGLKASTHKLFLSKAGEAKKSGQISPDDKYVPTALGLRMQINEVGTAYWHTGSNPGFRCFFIVYPKTQEILCVFSNSDNGFRAIPDILALFLNNKQTFWMYKWRQGELD